MLRLAVFAVLVATVAATGVNVTYEEHAPVSAASKATVKALIDNLKFDNDIATIIAALHEHHTREHATMLTGENPNSQQFTRLSSSVSTSNGINEAVRYVQERMTAYGFVVTLNNYRSGWGPNVIATRAGHGTPSQLVILGAHLDDIPNSGRAPGANDDGSGSAALLAIGQTLHSQNVRLAKTLVLEFYTGEEQGLVGSRAQAQLRRTNGDNVVAMIQQDMTGLKLVADPMGVAFVQDANAVDLTLTRYVLNVARQYRDSQLEVLERVISGSSCCSDHQSYKENGFPSVGIIEPRGYTGDPQYHRAGDLVNRADYSPLQIALTARVTLAAALDIAQLCTATNCP